MPLSQFFGLNIAASGLRAANAHLNTTGNNISNMQTEGYSRQKVQTEASDALRVFARYGTAGAGVDTITIERIRDEFYDTKYRNNETLYGRVEMRNYYNDQIERYLDDDGTTGFSSLFETMRAALQSVKTASGTTETKQQFVSSMQQITEYMNETATNLQYAQNDLNEEIKNRADQITSIAKEIATLNQQINNVGMAGASANELKDKRDYLIDELSKIISVEVVEYPIMDEYDSSRETGATRYEVWVAGGQLLLDTYSYNQLVAVARESKDAINQSDITGLYELKWASSKYKEGSGNFIADFRMDNKLIGGELQGLIDMRDGNNNQFFHGTVTNRTGAPGDGLNANPTPTVTISFTSDYMRDINKTTLPPMGQINIGSKIFRYTDWSADYDANGNITSYTLTMDPETTKEQIPELNKDAKIGGAIDYQGIPYYLSQMNEWSRRFSEAVNDIMVEGYTSDSHEGSYFLTGMSDSISQYSYDQLTGHRTSGTNKYEKDNKAYYNVKAENLSVVTAMLQDPGLLATKADFTEGQDEYKNLDNLKNFFEKEKIFRGATSGEFLDKLLADAALNKKNSQTMEDTYKALQLTIENQRQGIMGVDSDEEASALVQYQNMYTLSSKMIQTLTEVYDQLILNTGV